MEKTTNPPRSLYLSTRLYQALLTVYPAQFRRAYGGPMLQVFGDCCRRALLEAGLVGLLSLWLRTTLDTVQTAIEEHSQRGVDMSRIKFIKLSNWALILGGLAVPLGGLAMMRPEYDSYNAYSQPIDQYANAVAFPLIFMGTLLLSIGFIGLIVRYGQKAGSFGRYSLGLGALSGIFGAIVALGLGVVGIFGENVWLIFAYGIVFQLLGLTLFGLASIRQHSLPRWNSLPVLAGVWIPLYTLVTDIIQQASGNKDMWLPNIYALIMFLLTMAGLVGLGTLVQSDSQTSTTAPGAV